MFVFVNLHKFVVNCKKMNLSLKLPYITNYTKCVRRKNEYQNKDSNSDVVIVLCYNGSNDG